MNIKLNQNLIKDMCGTVSFKRGDAFYRANKVLFDTYGPSGCEATVGGVEDFHVTIEVDKVGGFRTECSCPTLASFSKDCQHIAAVLLAVYHHQRQGTVPITTSEPNRMLTDELLNLFNHQPVRSSGHQLHFENREVLNTEFICKPVMVSKGQYMFGIEMKIGSIDVPNIRDFLKQVKAGQRANVSLSFQYDPSLHCFQKENDLVIQQLITVISDEKVYMDALSDQSEYTKLHSLLLLPPSSWEKLVPLLVQAPMVKIWHDGTIMDGLQISVDLLPLQFDFTQTESKGYQLKIKGLDSILVLNAYDSVLVDGKLVPLKKKTASVLSS